MNRVPTDRNNPPSDDVLDTPSNEPGEIRKHTTVVQKFTEVVKPQTQPQSLAPAQQTAPETKPEDDDDVDPIDRLLEDVEDNEQGYVIRVDRLPQYNQDGRVGRGAMRVFCDEIPATLDYLTAIKSSYGGGTYKLTLKDEIRRIVKQWAVTIAGDPVTAPKQNQPALPATIIATQPMSEGDELDRLIKLGEKYQRLRTLFGNSEEQQSNKLPASTVIDQVPQTIERSLEERITEKIIDKVFDSGEQSNSTMIDRVIDKYFGAPEPKETWASIAGDLLKPLVPVLVPVLTSAIARSAAQPAVVSAVGVPMQAARQPALSVAPRVEFPQPHPFVGRPDRSCEVCGLPDRSDIHQLAQSSTPTLEKSSNEEDEPQMKLIDSLVDMLDACVQRAAADPEVIEKGWQEVEAFKQKNPMLAGFVQTLASGSPEMVLGMLIALYPDIASIQGNPIVLESISALQARLKGE